MATRFTCSDRPLLELNLIPCLVQLGNCKHALWHDRSLPRFVVKWCCKLAFFHCHLAIDCSNPSLSWIPRTLYTKHCLGCNGQRRIQCPNEHCSKLGLCETVRHHLVHDLQTARPFLNRRTRRLLQHQEHSKLPNTRRLPFLGYSSSHHAFWLVDVDRYCLRPGLEHQA